jgi:hypothetical protein
MPDNKRSKPADAQAEKPAMLATSGPLSSTACHRHPSLQQAFYRQELVEIGKMVNPYKKDNDSNAPMTHYTARRRRITPAGKVGVSA